MANASSASAAIFPAANDRIPNAEKAAKLWGHSPAGLFGYSHLLGGYPGGQAEYLRVPYADVGPIKVPEGLSDEQVLFLSDIFPTGYMGAEFCDIKGGETIAVFGCGPVAQFSIRSAFLLGAERVIAIDTVPERLKMAADAGAITRRLHAGGRLRTHPGADRRPRRRCLHRRRRHRAAHIGQLRFHAGSAKVATFLGTDRPHVLRQAIHNTRNFGVVSIIGVYGGFVDKIPMGSAINRGLTFRMAQTPVQHYLPKLLKLIEDGRIDPAFVITHKVALEEGPEMYKTFRDKQDGCIKVVMFP